MNTLMALRFFSTKWKEIKDRLELMNREIITRKQSKFAKDKMAFADGYAYKWTGRNPTRWGPPQNNHAHNPTANYTESDSSLSSSLPQQTGPRTTDTSTLNSPHKRLHYNGNTPPMAPNKILKIH